MKLLLQGSVSIIPVQQADVGAEYRLEGNQLVPRLHLASALKLTESVAEEQ